MAEISLSHFNAMCDNTSVMRLSMLCRPGGEGGGRAWGGDLIVFVGPGIGHLTDLVLPGEGIFESFFTRRGDI